MSGTLGTKVPGQGGRTRVVAEDGEIRAVRTTDEMPARRFEAIVLHADGRVEFLTPSSGVDRDEAVGVYRAYVDENGYLDRSDGVPIEAIVFHAEGRVRFLPPYPGVDRDEAVRAYRAYVDEHGYLDRSDGIVGTPIQEAMAPDNASMAVVLPQRTYTRVVREGDGLKAVRGGIGRPRQARSCTLAFGTPRAIG